MHKLVKKIALHVPGFKFLKHNLRPGLKNFLLWLPVIKCYVLKYILLRKMGQTESLISTTQSTVHTFDATQAIKFNSIFMDI